MNGIRPALVLGGIPVLIGVIYLALFVVSGSEIDPAGIILLVALGISMGFGLLVVLHGARDL